MVDRDGTPSLTEKPVPAVSFLSGLSGRLLLLTAVFVLIAEVLIFVPSVAGLSHNVKEHTEAADLVAGAQVLLNLMVELAEG